jgi:DnaJ-class molecular chaperone
MKKLLALDYESGPSYEPVQCKMCMGTGWAHQSIHPLFGVILDPQGTCTYCSGTGEDWLIYFEDEEGNWKEG